MNLDLSAKNAVVCGSTQGIGKATALELAHLGANVTLVSRNVEKLKAVFDQLPRKGTQRHDYLVADFAVLASVKQAIEERVKKGPVHILVNNTGGPPAGTALDAREDEFLSAFSAHLLCNHTLVQAVVPMMKSEKFGRIINVISTSVKVPIKGLGVSNTIRAAVANWSKTLSLELAPFGITVNNVLPGATMTARLESIIRNKADKSGRPFAEVEHEMIEEIPARRIGEAHEVASAIAFLASPAAAYINGTNIPVDGGRTGSL